MNDWSVLDVLPLGIVMVNRTFNVVRWNRWMEVYSGLSAQDVEGTSLFHHYPDREEKSAPTVSLSRGALASLVIGEIELPHGSVAIEGDAEPFATFLSLLDRFDFWFEIVMP